MYPRPRPTAVASVMPMTATGTVDDVSVPSPTGRCRCRPSTQAIHRLVRRRCRRRLADRDRVVQVRDDDGRRARAAACRDPASQHAPAIVAPARDGPVDAQHASAGELGHDRRRVDLDAERLCRTASCIGERHHEVCDAVRLRSPVSCPDGASVSPRGGAPAAIDQVPALASVAVSFARYSTPSVPRGSTVVPMVGPRSPGAGVATAVAGMMRTCAVRLAARGCAVLPTTTGTSARRTSSNAPRT